MRMRCTYCRPIEVGGTIACELEPVENPGGGYSQGLQYVFVYGLRNGTWRVWNRNTGDIAWTWFGAWPSSAEYETSKTCDMLNGSMLPGQWTEKDDSE